MIAPVYLQCEFSARDLDSRVLIAAYLLQQKIPVVIGQWLGMIVNVGKAPKGVNLFATCNRYQAANMQKCRKYGHKVFATDEEVLAIQDANQILRCIHSDAQQNLDEFAFQDAHHANVLRPNFPEMAGSVVGNARIELLRQHRDVYADEAEACRKNGRYVLINTNFSFVNSVWGSPETALEVASKALPDHTQDGNQTLAQLVSNQTVDVETVKSILAVLAKERGDRRIVVRPHPAENADLWRTFDGIEVVTRSNPIPWMLNADLVIHTTSTTGYEAALLGTPCINVGVPNPVYVMGKVNCTIPDVAASTEAILSFLAGKGGPISDFKSPIEDTVPYGARNIAAVAARLAQSLPEAEPIKAWGTIPRPKGHKQKLDVSVDAFMDKLKRICVPLVPAEIFVTPLDDSLFLLNV